MVTLLLLAGFITSCGKDEDKTPIFIGNYFMTEAKVSETFSVPITGIPFPLPVPAGTDITSAIQTALLSSVSCSSADKTYIEIREDYSLYLSCELANELNAGTWTGISKTELLLNLNTSAVPSAPTGVALQITDVTKTGGVLSGKTSVPIPKLLVAAMVNALNPDWSLDANAPDIFIIKFSLKLTQK